MKTKISILTFLFIGLSFGFAQQNEVCTTKLSIFYEYAKSKNYDAAYEPWMTVRNNCPKINNVIYAYGEKILNDKITNAVGEAKITFINDLVLLWEQRGEHFASITPKGQYLAKLGQLMYDNKKVLNKTNEDLFEYFDQAYRSDKKTFANPKSLYAYFSLMVDLYDAEKKSAADLFNKYDDVVEKIEDEVKNSSEKLNKLIEKEGAGIVLSRKEGKNKGHYENYLKNYDIISRGIDKKLGDRANCENLIPLYQKDFEANKTNVVWLKRAVSKMFHKKCINDPLYEKLVKAYDATSPSADTKYFVATILLKNGKISEAKKYLSESYDLETDTFKKSKLANRIGLILERKGRYGQARNFFRKALKLNPSNGRPYLSIARMYAKSANTCGDTNFNKRAVYWLAASEARKAGRVDPTQKKNAAKSVANYMAKAPQKSEVFSSGKSGQVIKVGCWIGESVTVPKI